MQRSADYTGLGAIAWELFSGTEPGPDSPFFERFLRDHRGRALDVGCGTGRLLLEYLQAGFDVEGVEPSTDMRTILHRNAAQLGLQPVVYDQMMQALDLPHTYQVIFVPCGSIQLVINRDEALEALRRFHAHLEPGGRLVLTSYNMLSILGAKPGEGDEWGFRARKTLPDGTDLDKHVRLDHLDLLDQTLKSTVRYRRLQGDEVIEEQYCTGDERWYFIHDLSLMLEATGFRDVRVTGNYADAPPAESDYVFCFAATA